MRVFWPLFLGFVGFRFFGFGAWWHGIPFGFILSVSALWLDYEIRRIAREER